MSAPQTTAQNCTSDEPPRGRRWIPLSLRIYVTMLMLAGLGSALWIGVPAYRQKVAIREIERLGGTVNLYSQAPGWLRSLMINLKDN
jgi:hypothetical protein